MYVHIYYIYIYTSTYIIYINISVYKKYLIVFSDLNSGAEDDEGEEKG